MNNTKERVILEQSPRIHLQGLYPVRVIRGRDTQGHFTCLEVKRSGTRGIRTYSVNVNHFHTPAPAIKDYYRRLMSFVQ